ncbi:MAG: hypothetical protein Q9222_001867 [Ikaeria aurantiellina]
MAREAAKHPLGELVRQSPPFDVHYIPDDSWMKDKVVIITGGASGFGEGFVKRWAAAGAVVIAADVNVEKGDRLIRDVKHLTGNPHLHFIHCDVTNWQSQVNLFKEAARVSPHGGIDTVVANAGIAGSKRIFDQPHDIDLVNPPPPDLAVLDVNLTGVVYTSYLALWYLPRNPGSSPANAKCVPSQTLRDRHLILIASVAGLMPIPGATLYGTSKHAVVGLYRNLRSSSFMHGVRVNLICPYFIDTPLVLPAVHMLLAGGTMGKADDVVDATTRFAADPRVVGRAVTVGPKLNVKQDEKGEWNLVEGEKKNGIVDEPNGGDSRLDRMVPGHDCSPSPPDALVMAKRPSYLTETLPYNYTVLPNAAFQPPEALPHRYPDMVDTFASYKYRNTCNISSLDLHSPFAPLCHDRKSLLTAMSSGGRIGHDAPYMPRDCDMRWFSTEEICEILSRFEKVIVLGDSMMRHVIGSMNVLIRKDLGYGAVTDWNFSPEERYDAWPIDFSIGIFKTADVVKNDPESVACPANTIDVTIEQMIRFPIPSDEIDRLRALLPAKKPARPYAFIFGHGLWNDLDLQATLDWLDTLLDAISQHAPWLSTSLDSVPTPQKSLKTKAGRAATKHERKHDSGFWPRLFLTPNAAGREKPDEWIVSQGNKALMIFEESIGIEVNRRGVEHLGTWNMSVQSNKFDGVHMDLKGNLIKAMMVMNWLNMLEVEKF